MEVETSACLKIEIDVTCRRTTEQHSVTVILARFFPARDGKTNRGRQFQGPKGEDSRFATCNLVQGVYDFRRQPWLMGHRPYLIARSAGRWQRRCIFQMLRESGNQSSEHTFCQRRVAFGIPCSHVIRSVLHLQALSVSISACCHIWPGMATKQLRRNLPSQQETLRINHRDHTISWQFYIDNGFWVYLLKLPSKA